MLQLKNVLSSLTKKELAKVLPIAVAQNRSYSDHQIPERLQHIPTAQNPKFFDMASFGRILMDDS